jgi:hypothetical protein
MLTGNASIHLIRVKRDMNLYSRKADQKVELLRGVIQRVQEGEEFDVEKALGTGDKRMEEEWFDGTSEVLPSHHSAASAFEGGCYVRFSGRGQADWDCPPVIVIREIENEERVLSRNERQRLRREARREEQRDKEVEIGVGNEDATKETKRRPDFL